MGFLFFKRCGRRQPCGERRGIESFRVQGGSQMRRKLLRICFMAALSAAVGRWDLSSTTPFGAKFWGIASIILWFGIVAAGRWIAFI